MTENVTHFCRNCVAFEAERDNAVLNFNDVIGPLDVQVKFVKQFKFDARKWKLILETLTI